MRALLTCLLLTPAFIIAGPPKGLSGEAMFSYGSENALDSYFKDHLTGQQKKRHHITVQLLPSYYYSSSEYRTADDTLKKSSTLLVNTPLFASYNLGLGNWRLEYGVAVGPQYYSFHASDGAQTKSVDLVGPGDHVEVSYTVPGPRKFTIMLAGSFVQARVRLSTYTQWQLKKLKRGALFYDMCWGLLTNLPSIRNLFRVTIGSFITTTHNLRYTAGPWSIGGGYDGAYGVYYTGSSVDVGFRQNVFVSASYQWEKLRLEARAKYHFNQFARAPFEIGAGITYRF